MKSIVKYFILLGFFSNLNAQEQGDITGNVIDENKLPFEFATIAIYQTENLVTGVITDEQGKFLLSNIPYGTYRIVVSYLGYRKVTLDNLILNSEIKKLIL
jgi:hypothetical protein